MRPGEPEQRELGCDKLYGRDKNVAVRWEALARVLRRVAELGSDAGRYRAAMEEGGPEVHDFEMGPPEEAEEYSLA